MSFLSSEYDYFENNKIVHKWKDNELLQDIIIYQKKL